MVNDILNLKLIFSTTGGDEEKDSGIYQTVIILTNNLALFDQDTAITISDIVEEHENTDKRIPVLVSSDNIETLNDSMNEYCQLPETALPEIIYSKIMNSDDMQANLVYFWYEVVNQARHIETLYSGAPTVTSTDNQPGNDEVIDVEFEDSTHKPTSTPPNEDVVEIYNTVCNIDEKVSTLNKLLEARGDTQDISKAVEYQKQLLVEISNNINYIKESSNDIIKEELTVIREKLNALEVTSETKTETEIVTETVKLVPLTPTNADKVIAVIDGESDKCVADIVKAMNTNNAELASNAISKLTNFAMDLIYYIANNDGDDEGEFKKLTGVELYEQE